MNLYQMNVCRLLPERLFKGLLLAGLFLILAGCSQTYEGDDTAARSLNEAGQALYGKIARPVTVAAGEAVLAGLWWVAQPAAAQNR